ncbi:hypothetical protein DSM112329_04718 [Paraconexibacter sp. AEG42_29]|uniref:Tetratricopeptide repeat protein n=1 Tax=Paraconexibacter sp. AEG42_29 TaxID=2997339 RepID=A0AAU7B1F2_9ACTN
MPATNRPRLYLSQDHGLDWLTALEFGATDDGQPRDRWVGVSDQVGLLHDVPDGRCIGFAVRRPAHYDPDDEDHAPLWDGPRFDVPQLGLTDVAPNAIVVAARAQYGTGRQTLNRKLFSQAIAGDDEVAVVRWRRCLEAGDVMAHYALGYTLLGLGRWAEAYRHLRYYCEIAPDEAWAWCYLGQAATGAGQLGEARTAYEHAVLLDTDAGKDEATDAQELLDALMAGDPQLPEVPEADDRPLWARTLIDNAGYAGLRARAYVDHEGDGTIVLDTADRPTLIDVEPRYDAVTVRAMIGRAPGVVDDEVAQAELRDEVVLEGENFEIDDAGDLWVTVTVPLPFDLLTPALLDCLTAGVVAKARHLWEMTDGDNVGLDPAPDYAATYPTVGR